MPLSKILPNPNKRGAVFTTFLLIALGMGLARLVPEEIPDDKDYWNYILGASFLLVSGGTVKYMVEGAIDDAAQKVLGEKVEEKTQNYKQQIEEIKNELEQCERNSPTLFFDRQHKGYRIAILQARHPQDFEVKLMEHPSLDEVDEDILGRESIIRGLADEDKVLLGIATKSCLYAWGLNATTENEMAKNPSLLNFRRNIYIYLRAWLMHSIKNFRYMPLDPIISRESDMQGFTLDDQINALTFLKDHLIDNSLLDRYLAEGYRKTSRLILKGHLSHLISELNRQK